MAAGGGRGGLGWVILVIALAVPGVLFYNWWSHLKAEQARAVAAKAAARVPDGGVFQAPPSANKLVNPMVPAASTAAAPAPVPAAASAATSPAADGSAGAAGTAQAATTPGSVAPAPGASVPAATAPPAASTAPAAVVALPLKRDPMLSPYDQVRILEEEEAKRRAAEDLERMKNRKTGGGPRKAEDPCKKLEVQGIVSGADGHMAIVNGDLMGVGQKALGRIKITRITDMSVTFDCLGKKVTKSVSQE